MSSNGNEDEKLTPSEHVSVNTSEMETDSNGGSSNRPSSDEDRRVPTQTRQESKTVYSEKIGDINIYIRRLKQENQHYEQNFETLRKRYLDLSSFHNEQQERWQHELQQKSQDFEILRQRFDDETQHMHQIQSKLTEELEIRGRLEHDLQEADQYRDKFQQLRREFELYRGRKDSELRSQKKLVAELESDLLEWKKQHDSLHRQLLTVKNLESKNYDGETVSTVEAPTVRQLQILLTKQQDQYETRIEHLRNELKDLSRERSELVIEKEEMQISLKKQVNELVIQRRTTEAELERQIASNANMKVELNSVRKSCEKIQEKLISTEKDLFMARGEKQSLTHAHNTEKTSLVEDMERERGEWQRQKIELESDKADAERQIRDLKSREQQMEQELAMLDTRANDRLKRALVEFGEERKLMQTKEASLQQQVATMQQTVKLISMEHGHSLDILRKENAALKNSLDAIEREKQRICDSLTETEAKLDQFVRKESEWEARENEFLFELEKKRRIDQEQEQKTNDLTVNKERLEMTVAHLKEQVRSLEQEMHRQKQVHQDAIARIAEQHRQRISALENDETKLRESIQRYRKQKARYVIQIDKLKAKCKRKLREYEQSNAFLSQRYQNSQEEVSEIKMQLSALDSKRQRKISSLERQRDHLQMLLEQRESLTIDTCFSQQMDVSVSSDKLSPMSADVDEASNAFDALYHQTLKQSEQIMKLHERASNMYK